MRPEDVDRSKVMPFSAITEMRVNTLMIQRVLGEPIWVDRMGPAERRGLTPLFWGHVNPYGLFQLDMATRLPIDPPTLETATAQLRLQGI